MPKCLELSKNAVPVERKVPTVAIVDENDDEDPNPMPKLPEFPSAHAEFAPSLGNSQSGRRRRQVWTDEEVCALLAGVKMFWSPTQTKMDWLAIWKHFSILRQHGRTSLDLKDKWRNLEKQKRVPPMPR